MHEVFPALEIRFNRSKRLRRLARKLYHGFAGEALESVRAFVDVTCDGISHGLDTFSTDEPVYTLVFSIFTRNRRMDVASEIIHELTEAFDDADIQAATFECVHMGIVGTDGPRIVDAVGFATMTFELHISRKVAQPLVRMGV